MPCLWGTVVCYASCKMKIFEGSVFFFASTAQRGWSYHGPSILTVISDVGLSKQNLAHVSDHSIYKPSAHATQMRTSLQPKAQLKTESMQYRRDGGCAQQLQLYAHIRWDLQEETETILKYL